VPYRLGPSATPLVWTGFVLSNACSTAVPSRIRIAASMPCMTRSPAARCSGGLGARSVPTAERRASTGSRSKTSCALGWASSSKSWPASCVPGATGRGRCGELISRSRYGHLFPGSEGEAAVLLDANLAKSHERAAAPASTTPSVGKLWGSPDPPGAVLNGLDQRFSATIDRSRRRGNCPHLSRFPRIPRRGGIRTPDGPKGPYRFSRPARNGPNSPQLLAFERGGKPAGKTQLQVTPRSGFARWRVAGTTSSGQGCAHCPLS
jgi:hypothetical protein